MNDTNLGLGGKDCSSRLIVRTGKYSSMDVMKEAHEASGAQIITVALRRVSLPSGESLLEHLDTTRYTLLPNTAGCYTADEAVRTAYLAREAGLGEMIKLEVIGDSRTLFPDVEGLLEATRKLARDGFTVMPYTNDDPVIARKLEEAGAACVMPLAAPIGSGLGIRNPYNIKIILESVSVPVIVDAGVGTASDAAIAMELGCEGVLMNTAIAGARDPVAMARAMRLAIEAGRLAYRAGRIGKKLYATASSPTNDSASGPRSTPCRTRSRRRSRARTGSSSARSTTPRRSGCTARRRGSRSSRVSRPPSACRSSRSAGSHPRASGTCARPGHAASPSCRPFSPRTRRPMRPAGSWRRCRRREGRRRRGRDHRLRDGVRARAGGLRGHASRARDAWRRGLRRRRRAPGAAR